MKFAFTDKTSAVIPVVAIHEPREVSGVYAAPKKVVRGAIALVLILIMRTKQAWASLDAQQSVSNALSYGLHVVLANVLTWIVAVESGVMSGLSKFYWEGHPWWACV